MNKSILPLAIVLFATTGHAAEIQGDRQHGSTRHFAEGSAILKAKSQAHDSCRQQGYSSAKFHQTGVNACSKGKSYGVNGWWCSASVVYSCR